MAILIKETHLFTRDGTTSFAQTEYEVVSAFQKEKVKVVLSY